MTSQQLTAIIFAQHQKLSSENPLLKQQIQSLENLNKLYVTSDSLQRIKIENYKIQVSTNEQTIQKLKSTQKKSLVGFSVGGIVLFIIGLIL